MHDGKTMSNTSCIYGLSRWVSEFPLVRYPTYVHTLHNPRHSHDNTRHCATGSRLPENLALQLPQPSGRFITLPAFPAGRGVRPVVSRAGTHVAVHVAQSCITRTHISHVSPYSCTLSRDFAWHAPLILPGIGQDRGPGSIEIEIGGSAGCGQRLTHGLFDSVFSARVEITAFGRDAGARSCGRGWFVFWDRFGLGF